VAEIDPQLAASLARRFRIVRRLGAGGMGAVFLAEQIAVGNRPVALKVLNRKLLDDPDFLLRFQNEAASTGRIHHPNVVTIYESGQADDGTPYIAMEFLEGESLRQASRGGVNFPWPRTGEFLRTETLRLYLPALRNVSRGRGGRIWLRMRWLFRYFHNLPQTRLRVVLLEPGEVRTQCRLPPGLPSVHPPKETLQGVPI